MFFWLRGVILTTPRDHPVGLLRSLRAPVPLGPLCSFGPLCTWAPVPHMHRIPPAYDSLSIQLLEYQLMT